MILPIRLRTILLLLTVLAVVMAYFGCHNPTTQSFRPVENYDSSVAEKPSTITLPFKVSIAALQQKLNQQLDSVLYEDTNIKDDRVQIRASKREPIRLAIDGTRIRYSVPLDLEIVYDAGLTRLNADGALELEFESLLELDQDWKLQSQTSVLDHNWIEKPRLRVGALGLGVEAIANTVLNRSKEMITRSIDQQIAGTINLREQAGKAWFKLHQPIVASEDFDAWIMVHPQKVSMTPLRTVNGQLTTSILVEAFPRLIVGRKPETDLPDPLPRLQLLDAALSGQGFELHLSTDVSYATIQEQAKNQIVGQTFSQGKRKVTVQDLDIAIEGNYISVTTDLIGSYDGRIVMRGKPVFNPETGEIRISQLNYSLDTKNFLHKTAGWLLKGTIRNKLEEQMNILLGDRLDDIREQAQEQIQGYSIQGIAELDGRLNDIRLENVYLSPSGLKIDAAMTGNLSVIIPDPKK